MGRMENHSCKCFVKLRNIARLNICLASRERLEKLETFRLLESGGRIENNSSSMEHYNVQALKKAVVRHAP